MLEITQRLKEHFAAAKTTKDVYILAIGGGAIRVMENLIRNGVAGVKTIAVHDEKKSLYNSGASVKIRLSGETANVMQVVNYSGREIVEGAFDEICDALAGAENVIILACLGGVVGTQGVPVVARIAAGLGATVYNVVSLPYAWEGRTRVQAAANGLEELKKSQSRITVIPNATFHSKSSFDTQVNDIVHSMNTSISLSVLSLLQEITAEGNCNEVPADLIADGSIV